MTVHSNTALFRQVVEQSESPEGKSKSHMTQSLEIMARKPLIITPAACLTQPQHTPLYVSKPSNHRRRHDGLIADWVDTTISRGSVVLRIGPIPPWHHAECVYKKLGPVIWCYMQESSAVSEEQDRGTLWPFKGKMDWCDVWFHSIGLLKWTAFLLV